MERELTLEEIFNLELDLLISEQMSELVDPDSKLGKFHQERTVYIKDLLSKHGVIFQDPENEGGVT